MDPYDAIVELLKKAQTRGLETVTNRLDFVVESLEELIQEAKSSVQEALPREADELFPVAEISAAVAELRQQAAGSEERMLALTAEVAGLQERLASSQQLLGEARRKLAAAGTTSRGGISLDLLRLMDRARSQSELLRELLPLLAEHCGRAVVLVLRGSAVSAWSGIGFADPEHLRAWQGEVAGSEALQRFASDAVAVRFAPAGDPLLQRWLGGELPAGEAILIPVCLRGKVMGGIYLDRVEGRPWNPDDAQALVALTCWLIDTLGYRQTVPTPMLAEQVDLVGAAAEPETPTEGRAELWPEQEAVVEEPAKLPPVEKMVKAVPEPAAAAPEAVAGPAPVEEAAPTFDPTATVRVELHEVPPVVPPPRPVEPVAEAAEAPSPARPLSPEEQARHEEARRFARLLVSEIKLYNEEEVERGRTSRDLYHRLKDDIDRSREMFEKRIPVEVRTAHDYFYDELLRILADGDSDALGM